MTAQERHIRAAQQHLNTARGELHRSYSTPADIELQRAQEELAMALQPPVVNEPDEAYLEARADLGRPGCHSLATETQRTRDKETS